MFTAGVFYYFPCAIVSRLSTFLQEPFECYHIADIESGLGLKRKQLVAMALLIGSDHDLHGVPGFGLETALRFVQLFDEDEILDKYVLYFFFGIIPPMVHPWSYSSYLYFSRLHEIGKGVYPFLKGFDNPHIDDLPSSSKKSPIKSPHCSHCGHPGSKKNHIKDGCNYCLVDSLENCVEKPAGFKCECPSCDKVGSHLVIQILLIPMPYSIFTFSFTVEWFRMNNYCYINCTFAMAVRHVI
jgi:flap endonuclease GEN